MNQLTQLHLDIDLRVQNIRVDHPDWLCGKGCDHCCRQLACVPELTFAEWDLLREGLADLPQSQRQEIGRKMLALASSPSRPVTCPLLDISSGNCSVYRQRPVACRTYGFYVQRDLGLYCLDIETRVAAGSLARVVWGNHDAIDHRLSGLGEKRALTGWFEDWTGGEGGA